ncbi:hypothetical protein D4R99_04070 [bacterium]|nr:MAG: hypothetical protein D4R99_04070 [bacterium]
MTDSIGILEHCIFSTPDRMEGYSTDDNARALQVVLRLNKSASEEYIKKYSSIYLQFLLSARSPQGFHQDLNADLTWKDDAGVEEGFGRAMAALGEAAITAPSPDQQLAAVFVFDQQALLIKKVRQNRAMSQAITALSHRMKFETTAPELVPLLLMRKKLKGNMSVKLPINMQAEVVHLADTLAASYLNHSSQSWNWYEDILSYDNGRLPLGMLYAYQESKDKKYLKIALESLDFLLAQTYDRVKDCFSFPGYRGWFHKGKKKALFGQQPIEAGSTVEVCTFAYEVTRQKKYLDFAVKALEWYNGRNILKINMLNTVTGGVKDGLEKWGVNPNEGAESILSFALASLAFKKAIL